jgi:hypothetical protein
MSIPAAPMPDKDPEKFYPSLYLDADGESDLAKLPEYGTMTVTFERERLSKNDTDGKKSVSVCLKIKSIDKVKAAPEDSGEDAGKVLDKYAAEEND